LGQIVACFKYQNAKQINQIRNTPGMPVWQRNYYEHIIRDEKELQTIREYIVNNPMQWELDNENPQNRKEEESNIFSKT
jgi:REP element-mobilizing transposase RayT